MPYLLPFCPLAPSSVALFQAADAERCSEARVCDVCDSLAGRSWPSCLQSHSERQRREHTRQHSERQRPKCVPTSHAGLRHGLPLPRVHLVLDLRPPGLQAEKVSNSCAAATRHALESGMTLGSGGCLTSSRKGLYSPMS